MRTGKVIAWARQFFCQVVWVLVTCTKLIAAASHTQDAVSGAIWAGEKYQIRSLLFGDWHAIQFNYLDWLKVFALVLTPHDMITGGPASKGIKHKMAKH